MVFDYITILMASGAAGISLCFTLVMSWLRMRSSAFLLTYAICIGIIILSILLFLVFQRTGQGWHAVAAGVLLISAYALSYGGLTQLRDGVFARRPVLIFLVAGALPIVLPMVFGLDGLSFLAINLMCAIMLTICGVQYWSMRAESPVPIGAVALLHFGLAITYVLCVAVLAAEAPLYLNGVPPDNWAEVVNLACSVLAITGIGGLFVTIHQERLSRRYRADSLIDPLTGLHNRRALYERFPAGMAVEGMGLIVFDLDEFKGHNDRYGHAFGDKVLRDFAGMLAELVDPSRMAVRLGGEEFLLVVQKSSITHALALAGAVRGAQSRKTYAVGGSVAVCTVSAGVAIANKPGMSLDMLIRKADNALYHSKRRGRNQVSQTTSTAA